MMRFLLNTTIAIAFSAVTANAADMSYPVNSDEMTTSVEYGSGWYIRGDIGYNINGRMKDGESTNSTIRYDFEATDALDLSIGFGFRFNDYMRLEANLERTLSGSGSNTSSTNPANCPTWELTDPDVGREPGSANDCLLTDSLEYSSNALMVNGYIDLPAMGKFQPYVGGGLGIARVSWDEEVGAKTCVPVDPTVFLAACRVTGIQQPKDGEITTFEGTKASGVDYLMSYSVSAGMGYRLNENMVLDANYRFLSTGPGDIDYDKAGSQHLGAEGFGVHQVRMGLRYEIN